MRRQDSDGSTVEQERKVARQAWTTSGPLVTIVMPALDEEGYIAAAISSILPHAERVPYELIVVDGGSTDRTRAIVAELTASNPHIRLLSNEKRIQAAGVNLGARLASPHARFLVRADCHLRYPENFVEQCIARIEEKGVASVVVPMRTQGATCLQKAIAAAQNSRLGNGGSAHRLLGRSGLVEHGHHAAFDRRVFLELGGYDESFTHNEDAEFDKRLVKSGRQIYLDSDATVVYYPRADLRSLARQYFSYGWGRASTVVKHTAMPRLRQMLPVAALLGSLFSLALATLDLRFLALPLAYLSVCAIWGLGLALRERDPCLALTGAAAIVMHMSWGTGFLLRLCSRPPEFRYRPGGADRRRQPR
jgi:succinoglycan biosynthesis protein ExoA